MSERKHWVPGDVLWEIGTAFIDATEATADAAVEAAMERVTGLLEASAAGVWSVDPRTLVGVNVHNWAASPTAALAGDLIVSPDPRVRAAVVDGGGLAHVPLSQVVGVELCREHGWDDGTAVVALVDQSPTDAVVLVITSIQSGWGANERELVQGLVLLLRQLNSRRRAETRLERRHRLDDLTVDVASRLQGVSSETVHKEIEAALVELRDVLEAASVVLIDIVDDNTLYLPHIIGMNETPVIDRTVPIPDISRLPGAEGLSLREYVDEPRMFELAELVDILMGAETTDAIGIRDQGLVVAILPASVSEGDALLGVTRSGADGWVEQTTDALTTFASLLAQTRGRVRAQAESSRNLSVQRTLASVGKRFLETDALGAETAIHETIEELAQQLDADSALIVELEAGSGAVRVHDSWSEIPELMVERGSLRLESMSLVDQFRTSTTEVSVLDSTDDLAAPLRDSDDGKWTTVVAPIRTSGTGSWALVLIWARGLQGRDAAEEQAHATANLIAQLRSRLDAERTVKRRVALDTVMADVADVFVGAARETAADAVNRALRLMGLGFGIDAAEIRCVRRDGPSVEAEWRRDGSTAGHETIETVLPLTGDPEESLVIRSSQEASGLELDAFRSFSVMLGQFRTRIAYEQVGQRRLEAQRLLSGFSVEFADAGIADFSHVLEGVLARVAEHCRIEAIIDLTVDEQTRSYVPTGQWVREDLIEHRVTDPISFEESQLLDEVRKDGKTRARVTAFPTPGNPDRLAVGRGEGGSVERIMLAVSLHPGDWSDDVRELLESVSRMIHEVSVRIGAQRYAEAAFAGAPIGVVLRDIDFRLITCNQSFVDFVGAASVDELIGTEPDFLLDDRFDSIEWETEEDGRLSAEAIFSGPENEPRWGQIRASPVDGDYGGLFWLIHVEDITERRQAEELLRFQASHDELTGLANRRQLLVEIGRAAAESGTDAGSVAVLLLDLDRFKNVNDSLGHDRGDELLVVVADRLRLAVRPGDLVARLGGDEFAVVLPGPVDVTDAHFVAERLMRLIGDPVTLGHQKIYPTASIGIAIGDDRTEVADLLRRADTAMYRAKADGRDRAAVFDEQLREEVTARMATESGLRSALLAGELRVHYQPEVSLHDRRILGAEALIRWEHPERGLLSAAEFIEVAEETGLVVEMGQMVLAQATREAATWPGGDDGPIIRVNLAAAQLQQDEIVAQVTDALFDSGIPASRLCLEITESAVMSDVARSEEILHRLQNLGVHLAIDDFGTGFSSLAYLKRFPVDALKIDRAFVRDLHRGSDDVAFVRSIVSLAEALGLDVVAEGVETEAQAELLLELGCRRAQGYLFAKPQPAVELRAALASANASP